MVKWNLNTIYDYKDTDKLISELKDKVNDFVKNKSKLVDSISETDFYGMLKQKEDTVLIEEKLSAYVQLQKATNSANQDYISNCSKINQLLTDEANKMLFFSLWFKDLNQKDADRLIKNSGKYKYLLERIRIYKPFTLDEKQEQIINIKDLSGEDTLITLYDMITNKFRYDWDGEMLTREELSKYASSPIQEERKKIFNLVETKYEENEDELVEIYKGLVKDWRNEHVQIRGYKSSISVRNLANDIPDKVIETLINVVKKNVNLFQEYFKLKAKVCKIENFSRYDIYAPLDDTDVKYDYETSKELVLDTYKKFDERAYTLAKQIFDEEHVHSDKTENKQSGAFCYYVGNEFTPFILLNHQNKLRDLTTMMHEFGHGIHGLCVKEQSMFSYHAALPLAETASIFGEMLLSQRLLKESEKNQKISLLLHMLDQQYASITRQVFFILFEIQAHEMVSKGCTIKDLNNTYFDNLKEQFGDISVDEIFKNEWKSIPHIHHSPFYCYAYAFGNLLVLSLYDMYKKQGDIFKDKYFKILSYGGSKSPADILSEVGIDISSEEFWQSGFNLINEEIKELKKLID